MKILGASSFAAYLYGIFAAFVLLATPAANANSLVGTWGVGGEPTTIAFDNSGSYTLNQTGGSSEQLQVWPGIETGTYSWDAATGALVTACPTVDNNGTAGLSGTAPGGYTGYGGKPIGSACAYSTMTSTLTVNGNTATWLIEGGAFTLTRITSDSSTPSASFFFGTWTSQVYDGGYWSTTTTINSDLTFSQVGTRQAPSASCTHSGTVVIDAAGMTATFGSSVPSPASGDAKPYCDPVGTQFTIPFSATSGDGSIGSTFTVPGLNITNTKTAMPTTTSATLRTLSVSRTGTGDGIITSNTGGISCGADCWADYASGASVTLTATPASGSIFTGWGGACIGAGTCVVTMNAAKSVTANFKPEPFVATTVSTITPTSATISTTIAFNAPDVGKSGAVYVTAWVPSNGLGALGILAASMSHALSVTTTRDNPYSGGQIDTRQETLGSVLAAADSGTFVLVQLTSSGWQLVSNGQLIPYVSGVLGDSMSALSILNNANPANLLGAQFCVGYGTSAAEMVTSGRMMQIASIDSTTASSGSCNVAAGIAAMEFYNAQIDHYFMTASTDEATVLDNKPEWNWVRTGKTFNIWLSQSAAPGNASPVCRFFGVFSNGTIGSHFYTVDATECDMVKGRLDWGWGYENDAFYAVKPAADGTCPGGTSPVYRAYNNGMGGAPNHRYVATQAEIDTMVAQGWVSEGTALCGVQ